MNEVVTPARPADAQASVLSCRLRPVVRAGGRGPVAHAGEVELANGSDAPVEIEYTLSPLQYLELTVTDAAGNVVSEGAYADRFSPALEPAVLRLMPGESFTAPVPLLATLPRDKRRAGGYEVRAVYDYRGLRAESGPVGVTLPG